jgi:hypothetical protein
MGDNLYYAPIESTWTVKWDKEVIKAPSAFDVLMNIGSRSYIPSDHKYPKRGIAYRVFVQYRIIIDEEISDEEFLMRLAEFGIIELSIKGKKPDDLLQEAVNFSVAWHGGTK